MSRAMAGETTVGYLAGTIGKDERSVLAELRSGSDEAYSWLVARFHQPVYSLVYRILNDPADAADTTQEVFLKVFRGIHRFKGDASLKTWIYRIAVHEASNQRRWWFRHKRRESSMDAPLDPDAEIGGTFGQAMADKAISPFERCAQSEVKAKVEAALRELPEPYRTTVVLRDIEGLAYEEIAAVLDISLGTVKSRLTRGRHALRQRLSEYVREAGSELGLDVEGANSEAKTEEVSRR